MLPPEFKYPPAFQADEEPVFAVSGQGLHALPGRQRRFHRISACPGRAIKNAFLLCPDPVAAFAVAHDPDTVRPGRNGFLFYPPESRQGSDIGKPALYISGQQGAVRFFQDTQQAFLELPYPDQFYLLPQI